MIIPRDVQKGQPVKADDFNKLLAFVRSLQLKAGPGIRVSTNTGGTTIALTPQIVQATSRSTSIIHPFQITDASDESGAKINIRFGLLNAITPTLADGVTELGTLTEIALTSAGTWVIFMAVAIVEDEDSLRPPYDYVWIVAQKDWTEAGDGGDPDLLSYQIIAEVDVVAGEDDLPDAVTDIRQNVTHGLKHQICGRVLADEEATPPISFVAGLGQFWGV